MIQRPPGRDGPLCQGLRLRSGPGRPRPLGLEDLGRQMSSDVGCHRSGLVEFIESQTGKEVDPFELSLAYGSFLFSWPSTTDCSNKEILGEQRCERRCERVKVCGFGVLWYVLKIDVFAWKSLVFGSIFYLVECWAKRLFT